MECAITPPSITKDVVVSLHGVSRTRNTTTLAFRAVVLLSLAIVLMLVCVNIDFEQSHTVALATNLPGKNTTAAKIKARFRDERSAKALKTQKHNMSLTFQLDHRLQAAAVEFDAQQVLPARHEQRVASSLHVAALHQPTLAVPLRLAAQALNNHSLQEGQKVQWARA